MRAALAVYRRRGSSGRRCDGCRRCPMAGVAPDGRCRAAHRIVDGTPVRRLDVQPGLVVGKSRLVAQLLSLWNGAGGSPAVGWLRRGEQGKAQREGAGRRFEVSCHCSKHLNRRHGRGARPAMARAQARVLSDLAEEALQGQVLRGGRSWPSDRKLGGGAKRSGNAVAPGSCGAGIVSGLLTSGVTEQNAEHKLHLS